jgi:hypothetical protein
MKTDPLEEIRAINPLPEDLPAPPIVSLPALNDRPARPRPARARFVLPKRAVLALPIAAVVIALVLIGQGGRRFDVAAAMYRATIAGKGVHYMFLEGEQDGFRIRYRHWTATDPLRERILIDEREHTAELVSGGGSESAWSTGHPHKILRVRGSAPVSKWDPVRVIQQAYRAGRLHVFGRTTLGGRAVYRARVTSPHGATGPTVIVDAHTFMPIEMIYRRPSGGPPTLVMHVRAYEELPASKANLALVRLAPHPGAHVLNIRRAGGR